MIFSMLYLLEVKILVKTKEPKIYIKKVLFFCKISRKRKKLYEIDYRKERNIIFVINGNIFVLMIKKNSKMNFIS